MTHKKYYIAIGALALLLAGCNEPISAVQLRSFDKSGFTLAYPENTAQSEIDYVAKKDCKPAKPQLVSTAPDAPSKDHITRTVATYRCVQ